MKLGFIGTGVMGGAIAGHLLDAGHELVVYNRTKSKTDALVAKEVQPGLIRLPKLHNKRMSSFQW